MHRGEAIFMAWYEERADLVAAHAQSHWHTGYCLGCGRAVNFANTTVCGTGRCGVVSGELPQ